MRSRDRSLEEGSKPRGAIFVGPRSCMWHEGPWRRWRWAERSFFSSVRKALGGAKARGGRQSAKARGGGGGPREIAGQQPSGISYELSAKTILNN